jgi:hypothetical protein
MVESVGGSLAGFVTWAVAWLARIGTAAAVLWGGWLMLKVIFAGGSGREAWRAVFGLLVIAVAVAALTNMEQTMAIVGLAGQRVWAGVAQELRAGLG